MSRLPETPVGREVTSAQASQWLVEQARPSHRGYLIPLVVELPQGTEWRSLAAALTEVVRAHPALRTSVRSEDGTVQGLRAWEGPAPRLVIPEPRPVVDLDDETMIRIIDGLGDDVPSIGSVRPWRAFGLTRDGRLIGLLWLIHHAVLDDPSSEILVEDLHTILSGGALQVSEGTDAPTRPRETDSDLEERAVGFRERLVDVPSGFQWPRRFHAEVDRSRRIIRTLDADAVGRLDDRLRELGATRASAILLAARRAAEVLGAPADGAFPIGVPMSTRDHPSLLRAVGMHLNTLPVPVSSDDSPVAITRALWATRRYRRLPFEVAARDVGRVHPERPPWLDLTIGVIEKPADWRSPLPARCAFSGHSPFPLLVIARFGRDLALDVDGDAEWIEPAMVARFAESLVRHLEEIAAGDSVDVGSVLSGPDGTDAPETLVGLFDSVANERPNAPALDTLDGESLSYAGLAALSRGIAVELMENDRPLAAPVAILSGPGPAFPIAVLSAMRAGAAAMPLSVDLPDARLIDLLRRSRPAAMLVTDPDLLERARRVLVEADIEAPILVVGPMAAPGERCIERVLPPVDSSSACYLLFTSGSSGEPKAVLMHHAGLSGLMVHERGRSSGEIASRTAQYAPLGFDVAFQEMFSTWALGGCLVPVPGDVRRDPVALASFVREQSITRLHLTPLMLRALTRACPNGFPPLLRELVLAGDVLRVDPELRRIAARSHGSLRLVNQYGPTETHVVTSLVLEGDPREWPTVPSIGSPIEGVVIRLLGSDDEPVPAGTAGEIVVEGGCVALGYLDGDAGGFESVATRRRYRTGDLARIGADGDLEFLGRRDEQVKISGYRVDPAEIEAVILALEGVEDVAVVAIGEPGTRRLAAFATGDLDPAATLELLADRLAPWMIPASLVRLDSLPRSRNGKVDRRTLRERVASTTAFATDGGPLSVSDVITLIESSGPRADRRSLAELGLDSLAAIDLQARIRGVFETEVPIRDLLASTADDIGRRLGRRDATALQDDVPRTGNVSRSEAGSADGHVADAGSWRPLDPLVRDVLAEDAIAPDGAFHLAWTIRLGGEVSIDDLRDRLDRVQRRYPTLRTRRVPSRGESTVPEALAEPVRLERFHGRPSDDELSGLLRHPLDLEGGCPWRAATWTTRSGRTELLLVFHHVAVDGRTAARIIDEIVAGAAAEAGGPEGGMPAIASNPEHDAWWVARVRSVIGEDPLPEVTFDRSHRTISVTSRESADVVRHASITASRCGIPPITFPVVAFGLILSRIGGRRHAVIGVPFASGIEEIGFGASVLPIPVDLRDDRRLAEVVAEVGGTIAEGLDRRDASLGRIIRRLEPDVPHERPPVDGVITRDDAHRHVGDSEIVWNSTGASVFQAGISVPNRESDSPVALEIEPRVLDGEDPADLLRRWSAVLAAVTDAIERDGDVRIGDIDELGHADHGLLDSFARGDDVDPAARESVTSRFREVAGRCSDRIAVVEADREITYAELDRWSRSIAVELVRAVGPMRGRSVAIAGPRGAATIAAMLGVVRAGGWFVPIDPALPDDRRRRQLEQSRPLAGIATASARTTLAELGVVLDPIDLQGANPAFDDADTGAIEVDIDGEGEAALYAMFTSGTTGEPRGAVIPHRAVHRLVDDPWFLPAGSGFRMLHAAPIAFDASTLEIWWPLLNGGTVCCWEGGGADLPGIAARIRRDGIDGCWLTAALFHAAVDGLPELFDDLAVVLTGGDVVSPEHVRRLQARRPDLAIVDGYGPTENTVFTACESLAPRGSARLSPIPIGRPIRGSRLRILDASGRLTAPGRFGELVVTGAGVGLGYLGGDGIPEDRDGFDRDPDGGDPRYRTGDRVRWRCDGRLEFAGRLDGQVKLAGRRVELGGIEISLRSIVGVLDACVALYQDAGRTRLGAVYVPVAGNGPSAESIGRSLRQRLPEWEVPSICTPVETIPATRNGKPDRAEVARLLRDAAAHGIEPTRETVPGRHDELVAVVCESVTRITGRVASDPARPVRDLGVDSLDLLRLALELENRVARPVRMLDVLEGGSPIAIATRIAADIDREHAELVTLSPGDAACRHALFCIPGVGGTVFSFGSILDGLPSRLPVVGLPYPGAAGRETPVRRLEDLGRLFADRIRNASPSATLLGYSLGGFAAFEAARELSRHGSSPTVVVVDSTPAGLHSRLSFSSRVASSQSWKLRLRNVLPPGVVDRLKRGQSGGRAVASLRAVVAAGFEALRSYDPSPAPVDVVLIRTTRTDFGPVAGIRDLGWGELARSVEVAEIPTTHLEVFRAGSMDLARVVRAVVGRQGVV